MCPYAYVNEHDRRLKCKLQNAGNSYKYCGYQRFCNTQKEWVNTYKMSRCVIRKDGKMNKIENNKEVTKTPPPVRKDLGGEDCVLKDIRNYGLEPRKVDRDSNEEKYKEGYLAEESIHGYVRYDLLDSESHKAFGFDP